MAFGLYQDEEMTQAATSLSFVFNQEHNTASGVLYFGSPNTGVALQTVVNQGVDNVSLSPIVALGQPERSTQLSLGQCFIVNGIVFQVATAGETAATIPSYPSNVGGVATDGTAVLNAIYPAHAPNEIKLALSEQGLDNATAGGALQLGNTIQGGAAIAIYYSITNGVQQVSDTGAYANLCLALNDCVEVAL